MMQQVHLKQLLRKNFYDKVANGDLEPNKETISHFNDLFLALGLVNDNKALEEETA